MFKWLLRLFGPRGPQFKAVDWYEVSQKTSQYMIMAKSNSQAEQKQALMQIDSLINNIFAKAGVVGNTFGERLKSLKQTMPKDVYGDLWQAHLKRNELAHEPDSFMAKWENDKYFASFNRAISYFRGRR